MPLYARSREGKPQSTWELLPDHLFLTACLTSMFSSRFGAGDYGYFLGLLHDIGKAPWRWQVYLVESTAKKAQKRFIKKIPHSILGAVCALKIDPDGISAAMIEEGHHKGLSTPEEVRIKVQEKWNDPDLLEPNVRRFYEGVKPPSRPAFATSSRLSEEFFNRMMFSCLVDADSLVARMFEEELSLESPSFLEGNEEDKRTWDSIISATEIIDAEGAERLTNRFTIFRDTKSFRDICKVVNSYLDSRAAAPAEEGLKGELNKLRSQISTQARSMASLPRGFFSMYGPTGAGKTDAGLGFGVNHIAIHGLDRLIVLNPRTSILDQTAGTYKQAMGEELASQTMLVQHSNLNPKDNELHEPTATENWESPIILSTIHQFFESIFSNRRGASRKLHNIARSLIHIDEFHLLPIKYRDAIESVLRELVNHYGCSVLLSSATKPEMSMEVVEIVPDSVRRNPIFSQRAVIDYSLVTGPITSWEQLAKKVSPYGQVCVVLHTRMQVRAFCDLLGSDAIGLTTFMCAAHREKVVDDCRQKLARGERCVVVSTTVIDTGIDISFPVGFRSLAGLDAIVQFAGRINRHLLLAKAGILYVFDTMNLEPIRKQSETQFDLVQAQFVMRAMLRSSEGCLDSFDPDVMAEYFRRLEEKRGDKSHDPQEIQQLRSSHNYEEVARTFDLIEEREQQTVIVPYGPAEELKDQYLADPSRENLRLLQPYTVSLYLSEAAALGNNLSYVDDLQSKNICYLHNRKLYDDRFGILVPTRRSKK